MSLRLTPLQGVPAIRPGDDLPGLLIEALSNSHIELLENDILVIAQKIISKAENRFIDLNSIIPSRRAEELARKIGKDARLLELVLQESNAVLRYRPGTIIVEHRLGFVCANAGIDHSNVSEEINSEDIVLLLPKDPSRSASMIKERLEDEFKKKIGVLVIDSHGRAWRLGTVGIAIGFSGIPGLEDLRGNPDMFGRTLQVTQVGVADELAAAASLVMGQADEGTPVIHVRGFPYSLREGTLQELIRPENEDLFR